MAVSGSAFARFARTLKQENLALNLIRCRQTHHTLPWKRRTFSARARLADQSSVSSKSTLPPKPLVLKNLSARPAGRPVSIAPIARPNQLRVVLDAMKAGERVVLYRSGNHGAFYVFAYGTGGALLVGAFLWAQMFLDGRETVSKPGYLMQSVMLFEALAVTAVATVIILAPTNLIKKVSILKQASTAASGPSPYLLEFSIKRRLPFLKPDILETSFDKVSISRAVPGQKLNYLHVPLSHMNEFNSDTWRSGKKSSLMDSVLRTVPAIVRETRRSFMRDQMALVVVKGVGTHKLDLQGACLLGDGDILKEFMRRGDDGSSTSIWARLVARFRS